MVLPESIMFLRMLLAQSIMFLRMVYETRSILWFPIVAVLSTVMLDYDKNVMPMVLLQLSGDFESVSMQIWFADLVTITPVAAAIVGAALGMWGNDHFGRRMSILIADWCIFIGYVFCLLSLQAYIFILGRVMYGIGVGIITMSLTVYLSEFSPPEIRSILMNLVLLLGALVESYLTPWVVTICSQILGGWHLMLCVAALFLVAHFYLVKSLPDTPLWLHRQAKHLRCQEAPKRQKELDERTVKASLAYIYPKQSIEEAFNRLTSSQRGNQNESFVDKLRGAFQERQVLLILFTAITVELATQIAGFNKIIEYSPKVVQLVGFNSSEVNTTLANVSTALSVVIYIVGITVVPRIGARRVLVFCLSAIIIIHVLLSMVFYFSNGNGPKISKVGSTCVGVASDCVECLKNICVYCTSPGKKFDLGTCLSKGVDQRPSQECKGIWFHVGCPNYLGYPAFVLLICFRLFYFVGLTNAPATMMTEMFSVRFRGFGAGIMMITKWILHLYVQLKVSTWTETMYPGKILLIHAGFCVLVLFPINKWVPETNRMPLENINDNQLPLQG